ncbi:Serine/threonine-protein kinase PEPKR2 [Camellia lanceoleosa]|uniref:Serine/threonine-protein kinase PEPKR2 n=2 Tax=Camellia lanceoleosa TaxID=1840588 RepID=A0ACC0HNN9_9ERIC|nr:Serine/threonine-protein kinase PEPKR2 [Camellia lanceoleosa]KAI8014513.1 Serine/threonine-protein kinase PEPKR2 [Camellia lanceoleosa]
MKSKGKAGSLGGSSSCLWRRFRSKVGLTAVFLLCSFFFLADLFRSLLLSQPENILLTNLGKIKLADFGLAIRIANGQRLTGLARSPAYVAPEVLLGDYSEKVDMWSAGVLLHALLTGLLPFQ